MKASFNIVLISLSVSVFVWTCTLWQREWSGLTNQGVSIQSSSQTTQTADQH